MKTPAVLNTKAGQYVVLAAVGALVVIVVYKFFKAEAGKAVDAVSRVNEGTPYQGGGVVGTLGNVTNAASGGLFESIGSWIGGKIADATQPKFESRPLVGAASTPAQIVGDNFYDRGLLQ